MRVRVLGSMIATTAVFAALSGAAVASCISATAQEQRTRASVIFDGVALENPTGTGVQRFRITRYIKGRGPHVVRVSTGFIKHADGSGTLTSVSLIVRRGERWRIYGRGSATSILRTSVCAGSRKL